MVPFDWDEEMKVLNELLRPEFMLEGSCDFLLGWELLAAHRDTPAVKENRARTPTRARATCACMALELALKALITIEGNTPERTHEFVHLFEQLSADGQREIASAVLFDGKPTTAEGVVEMLKLCAGTFERWRYTHEHWDLDLYDSYIIEVTRAAHDSIRRRMPEWRQRFA